MSPADDSFPKLDGPGKPYAAKREFGMVVVDAINGYGQDSAANAHREVGSGPIPTPTTPRVPAIGRVVICWD